MVVARKSKMLHAKRSDEAKKSSPPKRNRIKTGIINLDPLVGGGLKQNSIALVMGGAGSGKTIFALQFLLEGLRQGETCLYITFEEKKEKLYDDMRTFGWELGSYEDKNKFFYLEYNPEQVKSLIEEGGGSVDQIIAKYKITRVAMDSVTSFSLLYQDELAKKEAGLALFELINKWGCTAVLTAQATDHEKNLHSTLEFEADSIIILYNFKKNGKRERALEVLKMRGTNHTDKTLHLEITKQGLKVNPHKITFE